MEWETRLLLKLLKGIRPEKRIVEYAKKQNGDLIVKGSRGLRWTKRSFSW